MLCVLCKTKNVFDDRTQLCTTCNKDAPDWVKNLDYKNNGKVSKNLTVGERLDNIYL